MWMMPDLKTLANGREKPILDNGFIKVPETPGLGVDLNEEAIKKATAEGEAVFCTYPQWDKEQELGQDLELILSKLVP